MIERLFAPLKKSCLLVLCCLPFVALSAQVGKNKAQLQRFAGSFVVDYQSISLKDVNREALGIAGLHFQLRPQELPFYGGVAVFGAVEGDYSGFFALGLEAGFRREVAKNLELNLGAMVGAGGGHNMSSFIEDGNMLQLQAGFLYRIKEVKLGVAYENFRFLNTPIVVNSAILSVAIPFDVRLYPFDDKSLRASLDSGEKYVAFLFSAYYPYDNVTNLSGQPDLESTKFIGAEFGYQFFESIYGYVNFKGAVYGHSHGYADLFLGGAYKRALISDKLKGVAKVALGTGGGAGVNTGSGFLVYPQAGLEYKLTSKIGAEVDYGYLAGVSNSYRSDTVNAQLNYYLNAAEKSTPYHLNLRLGNQTYLSPDKTNVANAADINLISVKIDSFLNDLFYLSGQTAFAYSGDVAGYFSGLVGLGLSKKLSERLPISFIAEGLIGAAGGAGLDLGQGLIYAPNLGLAYTLNKRFDLYALGGKTISSKGHFSSTTVEAGLKYKFSLYL